MYAQCADGNCQIGLSSHEILAPATSRWLRPLPHNRGSPTPAAPPGVGAILLHLFCKGPRQEARPGAQTVGPCQTLRVTLLVRPNSDSTTSQQPGGPALSAHSNIPNNNPCVQPSLSTTASLQVPCGAEGAKAAATAASCCQLQRGLQTSCWWCWPLSHTRCCRFTTIHPCGLQGLLQHIQDGAPPHACRSGAALCHRPLCNGRPRADVLQPHMPPHHSPQTSQGV